MNNKFKKRLVYLILSLLVVSSITLIYVLSSNVFSGEIVELAIATNAGVSCKSWTGVIESDVAGNKISYNPFTVNFPVVTQFNSILSTKTGNTLSLLDTSAFVECKPLSSSFTDINLVGGTVRTTFYGLQENGQWITLKTVDRNISTVAKPVLNQKQIIPTGAITGTEINSKLTSSKEFFITQVKSTVNANFIFKGKSTGTLINTGSGTMSSIIYVKMYNPITTPTPSTSTVVKLVSLSPVQFNLNDYVGKTLSLTVTGQLPEWKDSEGIPYVEIIDPLRHSIGKFPMSSKKLVSSTTNTYEFKAININIPKSPVGNWQVYMHSNADVRKLSANLPSSDVKTFSILGLVQSPTPVPTTGCITLSNNNQEICLGDDEFKQGGVCYGKSLQQCADVLNEVISGDHSSTSGELSASAFISYKLTYDQGGTDVGQVPKDGSISVDFVPLNFVASPKGIDEKLQTVTLIQSIDTKAIPKTQITNLNINTKFNILVDGTQVTQDTPLNTSQLKKLGVYSTLRDYYMMNQIILNSNEIKQMLQGIVLSEGQTVTLQSVSDGTFDISTLGASNQGSFVGLTFTYDLRYVSDENFNPDPCKGLSGEALLQCQGGDPDNCVDLVDVIGDEHCSTKEGSTGGSCQGLTPQQCADQGKSGFEDSDDPLCVLFGTCDNPKGESKPVIFCPNGSFATKDQQGNQYCVDNTTREKVTPINSIPDIESFLSIELIVIIILGLLFIVLLVVLVKRRRK
jgi:hypothetical protein